MFGVAVKIYNVGRLDFLVSAQPRFCFSRHRHVFIYSASKTFAHLEEKTLLTDTDKKKILADIGKEGEQIPVQKKNHLVKSIKHFLIDIIQISFRD